MDSSTRDSSANLRATARSVATWPATRRKLPGSVRSSTRIAASSTGSVSGRRPASADRARPSRSASANGVRNATFASPPCSPSMRRAVRPARFEGTTTVTGASGSSAWAARTASRRASVAARP